MNINNCKQTRNGIRILSTTMFYVEDLFVVCDDDVLVLMSNEHRSDIITATKDDEDPSFIYQGFKYKIIRRTRYTDKLILDAGFDFQNTVQTQTLGFIDIRQIKLGESPNTLINLVDICSDVVINSQSIKIVNDGTFLQNVKLTGKEIVISCDLSNVVVNGNNVFIAKGSKNLNIHANDSIVQEFCQNVYIGEDCEQVIVESMCKNIQIKNACRCISIQNLCQNIIIENQSQEIKIGMQCGINGCVQIGSNTKQVQIGYHCANFGQISIGHSCCKDGQIKIGDHCGSDNGRIQIYDKCNGNIIIEDYCGFNFGQLIIQSLCRDIKIHQYTSSGNCGTVFISSNCKQIDIDIGQDQQFRCSQGIQKCILTKTDDFDSANFAYYIKKSVDSNILKIAEYKTIGSVSEDTQVDMFDNFKRNENFKIRM